MNTYNENETCKETQDTASVIWKILVEMGKSPSTYKNYAEKTVEEVANEIKKGEIYWDVDFDDPLSGAYYTVVQNHTMDEESKAIAIIIQDFDDSELTKSGMKVQSNQQLASVLITTLAVSNPLVAFATFAVFGIVNGLRI